MISFEIQLLEEGEWKSLSSKQGDPFRFPSREDAEEYSRKCWPAWPDHHKRVIMVRNWQNVHDRDIYEKYYPYEMLYNNIFNKNKNIYSEHFHKVV